MVGRKSEYVSSVYADDFEIGRLAAKAIAEAGCKNSIYIGESSKLDISVSRAKGFEEEIRKNSIYYKSYFCEEQEMLSETLDLIFLESKNIDSIFCFSDFLAFKVMKYLLKNKIKNVLIVGVDNIRNEIPFPIPFWSIGQNKEKIANDVIDLLFKQISNIDKETKFIIEEIYLVKEID